MQTPTYKTALIVGRRRGMSASLARLFAREKTSVALAARKIEKLGALCTETGARAFACDAPCRRRRAAVLQVAREIATPDLVVYNASGRPRGPFTELAPADVANAIAVSALAASVAQQAVKAHAANKHGAILFHRRLRQRQGLCPSSAPLRDGQVRAAAGWLQSMARELSRAGHSYRAFRHRRGIRSARAHENTADQPDSMLDPDAIALELLERAATAAPRLDWEMELRPWDREVLGGTAHKQTAVMAKRKAKQSIEPQKQAGLASSLRARWRTRYGREQYGDDKDHHRHRHQ